MVQKKFFIPSWLKRELVIFGGMILESTKFILVSFFVFSSVYGVINGPAVWNNVRWWWHINYADDKTASWWGIKFPETGGLVEPDNTLFIPKIGVQAPIIYSSSRNQDDINKLLLEGVVHYNQTSFPGEKGNVFITGHSSYYWWSDGKYNTVFSILDKLVSGDVIYINYKNKRYTYQVYDMKVVLPNDISVLEKGNDFNLTLMTCTPVGTNYKRLIVKAKQIEPVIN
uniref:Class D sortase n=1 Tax=candidate division CPR3 bacterium TaxID=2268181 RepID=A0A7C4QXR3_UNCC3